MVTKGAGRQNDPAEISGENAKTKINLRIILKGKPKVLFFVKVEMRSDQIKQITRHQTRLKKRTETNRLYRRHKNTSLYQY